MEARGGGMTMVGFAEFIHSLGVETAYNLDGFLDGDIEEMLKALRQAETAEKLKGENVQW